MTDFEYKHKQLIMFTAECCTLVAESKWRPFGFHVDLSSGFRLNEAPVAGFEKDIGSKTTMRITYPEGAIQKPERYEKSSLFVLSAFKHMDFKWLHHMVFDEKLVRRPKIGPRIPHKRTQLLYFF